MFKPILSRRRSLLMAMLVALAGCQETPCRLISEAGWTCKLSVVDDFAPGHFLFIKGGITQQLAGDAEGFVEIRRPTNIENLTHHANWTFNASAGIDLPADGSPQGAFKTLGVTEYRLTFSNTEIRSLAPANNADPAALYADARKRAEAYLAALSPAKQSQVAGLLHHADRGEVWLITETLVASVDYQFTGSADWNADGGATARQIKITAAGGIVHNDTKTISFTTPLAIGYHAVLLASDDGRRVRVAP